MHGPYIPPANMTQAQKSALRKANWLFALAFLMLVIGAVLTLGSISASNPLQIKSTAIRALAIVMGLLCMGAIIPVTYRASATRPRSW